MGSRGCSFQALGGPKNRDEDASGGVGWAGPGVAPVHAYWAALGQMPYGADPVAVLVLYGDLRTAVLAPQSAVNRSSWGLLLWHRPAFSLLGSC